MLQALPVELLERILFHLSKRDVLECCQLNHNLTSKIYSFNKLWRGLCTRECIQLGLSDTTLQPVFFYRQKLYNLGKRLKRFDMKGYHISDEELQPLSCNDVRYVTSGGTFLFLVTFRRVYCYDVATWSHTHELLFEGDIELVECTADGNKLLVVMATPHHHASVLDITTIEPPCPLYELNLDEVVVGSINCIRMQEERVAILYDHLHCLVVFHGSKVILRRDLAECHVTIAMVREVFWGSWDGAKHGYLGGVFYRIMEFLDHDKVVIVTPRSLLLHHTNRYEAIADIRDSDCTCEEFRDSYRKRCRFWPNIAVSDDYVVVRCSCDVRLLDPASFSVIRKFEMRYDSVERQIKPIDRANIVDVGSRFMLMLDSHWFPKLLVVSTRTGKLEATIGEHRGELTQPPLSLYQGIYHMSYICRLPTKDWLNGNFSSDSLPGHNNPGLPCCIAYKTKDHISPLSLTLFYLEHFKVRLDSQTQDYFEIYPNSEKMVEN